MTRSVWWAVGIGAWMLPLTAMGQTTAAGTESMAREMVTAPTAAPAPPELPEVLTMHPGGITAERAGAMGIAAAALVRAAHANTEAAEAARTEAAMGMVPQLTVSARYTRLSEITPPRLNFGSAAAFCVNTQTGALYAGMAGSMGTTCVNPRDSVPVPSTGSAGFSFPVILNQYAVNATLTVPISDIPFRLARVYEAAGLQAQARRFDEEAQRATSAADARVAFYEYLRAQGQLAITQQAVETARRHREDLTRFVEAGTVARVELLRVDAQMAESERMLVMAREGAAVAEANARIRLNLLHGEPMLLGEDLTAPVDIPGDVQALIDRAWRSRPELESLNRQISALDANLSAVRAGYLPSLVGQASVDIANPNQRFQPATEEWNTTWSATLNLQWSLSGALQNSATASRVIAQREAVRAQMAALFSGVELDIRSTWTSLQAARAGIEAANRQLAAAQESYRVRRERFGAGSAISSDLTDAENDLLRARFAVVNAHVDLRIALMRLRRLVGTAERAN